MNVQTTFQRYEMKYLITASQKEYILREMLPHMKADEYGNTTIRNIYFDTPDYRLIRRSLEKPDYKEKLRIRSYKQVSDQDDVFVELKKKYDSVVYKRRLTVTEQEARYCFTHQCPLPVQSQISHEIAYFRAYYGKLIPVAFISYEREAYYDKSDHDFRITFDENILFRNHDFSLGSPVYGTALLEKNLCLMEIKIAGGMPLWLCDVLHQLSLHKISFSKYGAAYQQIIYPTLLHTYKTTERNLYYVTDNL